jgi:hypothetical protein
MLNTVPLVSHFICTIAEKHYVEYPLPPQAEWCKSAPFPVPAGPPTSSRRANMNKYVLSSERKYPNRDMDDAHE